MKMVGYLLIGVLASSAPPSSRNGFVERSIGQLTVGVSTLDDAKRIFGASLKMERGLYVIRPGTECELAITLEDTPHNRPPHKIVAISLTRNDQVSEKSDGCQKISTGKGITLSDSLQKIQQVYGKPTDDFVRDGMRILGYDNSKLCDRSSTKQIELNGVGFEWSQSAHRLVNIHIDVSTGECTELGRKR